MKRIRSAMLGSMLGCVAIASGAAPAAADDDRWELDGPVDGTLLGAGAALVGTAWVLNERLRPLDDDAVAALDPGDLPAFDRYATRRWSPSAARASDWLRDGLFVAPLLLLADPEAGDETGSIALMYAETVLLQRSVVGTLKGAVQRPRPLAHNADARIPAELRRDPFAVRSFPSGHAATAFAGAVFASEIFARLHPDDTARHWIRGGGLAAASATAWLRVEAGHHFPTDVLAGAAIGALIGWGVPRLHALDSGDGSAGDAGAATAPLFAVRFAF